MTSFSVAKKIREEEINRYFSKHRKSGKTDRQIGAMMKEKILSDINGALDKKEVPGIISMDEAANSMGIDKESAQKITELNRLIMVIAHKISEKKCDKMALCYFINSLVNVLGLSEEDFTKFHRQNGSVNDNPETDEEDDDDEDDDDDEFGNNAG